MRFERLFRTLRSAARPMVAALPLFAFAACDDSPLLGEDHEVDAAADGQADAEAGADAASGETFATAELPAEDTAAAPDVAAGDDVPTTAGDTKEAGPTPAPVGCVTDVGAGHHLFDCDGGIRYDVEIPTSCAGGGCGLVLDIHGLTMSATEEDAGTGMRARGREHGYVVVQPNAPGVPASWLQALHAPRVFDFVRDLADALVIDPRRIHVTGFSQGGGMTWRLICDHADFFASAAPLAGLPGCAFAGSEVPSREVPVMQVHGHRDTILNFTLFALPQRDLAIAHWELEVDAIIASGGGLEVTRYLSPSGTPFEFWEHDYAADSITISGHCFPGGTDIGPSPLQFGCADAGTFSVGERVMQFFLDHPKD